MTGAGGDIGRQTALALAVHGAELALADLGRAGPALAETARRCAEAGAPDVATYEFDVTSTRDVDAAVADCAPDLVVNNAGYQGEFAPLDRYPIDDFRRVLDVNVVGVFNILKAASAELRRRAAPGAIVNVASMAGVAGPPNMPAYSAAKGAVIALTKAAATDLAPHGIRVNAVSPGFIGEGAMWVRQVAQQADVAGGPYSDDRATVEAEMVGQVPLGRPGRLSEVASVIVFLLSDASSYMTGGNVEIAGGAG